ncbi:hypothetical protein AYK25_02710 [Thermoplasmatales archaeon SM1-50]|nr:MAG: hypothetical protein AYK25_02710 [Thermoplasmatales archaeon SM1-50]
MKKKLIGMSICIILLVATIPVVSSLTTYKSSQNNQSRTDWIEKQKLLASDGSALDYFGTSVSLDGDTALIGAFNADVNGIACGSAYVFNYADNTWTEQTKLIASDGELFDCFGCSVSLDGDTALIGASDDDDHGSCSGSAYVFLRSGTTWTQQAKLLAFDGEAHDDFGCAVSVYGNTALIGASHDGDNGEAAGAAYVFTRTSNTWAFQAKLLASDGIAWDRFGSSVSLYGDIAIIGAPMDDDGKGSVYVFTRSGSTWTQQQKLQASDGNMGHFFGYAVSLYMETVLIGAYGEDSHGQLSGSAYVFIRIGTTWAQQAKLLALDNQEEDGFGWSVSLEGTTAVIGAPWDDDNGDNSGSTYVFTYSGNLWTQVSKILPSDGGEWQYFGNSVSHQMNTTFIAADHDDDKGDNSGSVYVLEREEDNTPPSAPYITGPTSIKAKTAYLWNFTAIDPENNDIFYQIDWGDNTITDWIGSYHSGETMSQSHVYLYKGEYQIKAKAKDLYNNEGDWGTLSIYVPTAYNKPTNLWFWEQLLERFPNAFPILRHLFY